MEQYRLMDDGFDINCNIMASYFNISGEYILYSIPHDLFKFSNKITNFTSTFNNSNL